MTKNRRKKNTALKNLIKIAISLGLHKGHPSYRRSLQTSREHPALQKI
jgi:hypothetical protein